MRSRDVLDAPEALVLTMVLVAAADGGITDRKIGIMAGLVQTLPAFHNFAADQFRQVTDAAVALLREEDGLKHAGRLLRGALNTRLHETAYALACEVVAGAGSTKSASLDILEFVRQELHLDPLIAVAIERGIRARYVPVE
jgi:tellurite resistance protein